jgi:predicted RNA-binding Zn-ribbon protein involved in translation (DUF1610 family)
MTSIKAVCPDCGDINITDTDLRVRICVNDDTVSYTFRCPTCHLATGKPCSRRIGDMLLTAGVKLTAWSLPAELSERHPAGAPFTPDDVLDFFTLLASADTLDAWTYAPKDVT